MEIIKFAVIGIICAILTVIVRQYRPELAVIVQLGGIAVLAIFAVEYLKNIFTEAQSFLSDVSLIDDGYIKLLVKVLGIAIITKLSADICSENSSSALATVVELTGKSVILAMCLSLIKTLAELAKGLIE